MGGRSLVADQVPFVEKEATNDDELFGSQIIKNQIVVRTAPTLSRALTASGGALLAESVRRSMNPVESGRRHVMRGPQQPKPTDGSTYTKHHLFAASDAGQRKRAEARAQNRQRVRVAAPRAAGTGALVLGKLVPVMAYGYVGYNLLTGESVEHTKPQDPWRAMETAQALPGLIKEVERNQLAIARDFVSGVDYTGIAMRTGVSVGLGLLTGIFS